MFLYVLYLLTPHWLFQATRNPTTECFIVQNHSKCSDGGCRVGGLKSEEEPPVHPTSAPTIPAPPYHTVLVYIS